MVYQDIPKLTRFQSILKLPFYQIHHDVMLTCIFLKRSFRQSVKGIFYTHSYFFLKCFHMHTYFAKLLMLSTCNIPFTVQNKNLKFYIHSVQVSTHVSYFTKSDA